LERKTLVAPATAEGEPWLRAAALGSGYHIKQSAEGTPWWSREREEDENIGSVINSESISYKVYKGDYI
jgi:hypothetical protein